MSVFTTRSLLHALGVSRGNASSSAVAVNWVIKVSTCYLLFEVVDFLFSAVINQSN